MLHLNNKDYFMKPKLLLHFCCANCGAVPIEILKQDFDLTLFWFNPNIQPREEYEKRLKDGEKLAIITGLEIIKEFYQPADWFKEIKDLEKEPEGGKRCKKCFQMRLEKTAQKAKELKFEFFATALTVGPQKKAEIINNFGNQLSEKYQIAFFSADFKKKDGFKKSLEFSKKYDFYRQNYCGCIYSKEH